MNTMEHHRVYDNVNRQLVQVPHGFRGTLALLEAFARLQRINLYFMAIITVAVATPVVQIYSAFICS